MQTPFPSRTAQAGTLERADCVVTVRDDGPPVIEIAGKTRQLYGGRIRQEVSATLLRLAARDVHVHIDDQGALPFTLAARLETALRRLRPGTRLSALTPTLHATQPATRRRSRLYLPGNVPRYFVNAALHGPDVLILDLEDAVAATEKDAARDLVRHALASLEFAPCEVMVRINSGAAAELDIAALQDAPPHTLLLPKVERAAEVSQVRAMCEAHGLGAITLVAIIESARGVMHALEIAEAGVSAIALGLEDYTADLGVPRTAEGDESAWACGMLVNAARAAGVQALASVYSNVDDADGLHSYATRMRALGFDGIGCIHPRQVGYVHAAYAPSAAAVAHARALIAAYEGAGGRATSLGGMMVDAPVVARARQVLQS